MLKKIEFTGHAERDLKNLDPQVKGLIKKALRRLAEGLEAGLPLSGEWRGFYKLRVGDYRIIYKKLDEESILVRYVSHRREAYR